MTPAGTVSISPFFIVSNVEQTIEFYKARLGFQKTFQEPAQDPFFAAMVRNCS
jgi:catechol 2,3-dioxygenase-like lactoylglutathione lyase family enzyme